MCNTWIHLPVPEIAVTALGWVISVYTATAT